MVLESEFEKHSPAEDFTSLQTDKKKINPNKTNEMKKTFQQGKKINQMMTT